MKAIARTKKRKNSSKVSKKFLEIYAKSLMIEAQNNSIKVICHNVTIFPWRVARDDFNPEEWAKIEAPFYVYDERREDTEVIGINTPSDLISFLERSVNHNNR